MIKYIALNIVHPDCPSDLLYFEPERGMKQTVDEHSVQFWRTDHNGNHEMVDIPWTSIAYTLS